MNAKTPRDRLNLVPNLARVRGFSLIELMTVVGVLAILGVIAAGSYRNYVLRSNRTDGRNALMRMRVAEEKFFLQNNTYTTNFTGAPPAGLGLQGPTSPGGWYTLTVAPCAGGAITTCYLLTATAASTQTQDTAACQVFTIDDSGNRTPADTTGCWK
jgi:type IV pilus assembly protein PilE